MERRRRSGGLLLEIIVELVFAAVGSVLIAMVGETWLATFWIVLLLCLGARWIYRSIGHRARQRRAEGRCESCGYDLHATPERCPECGRKS